MYAMCFVNHNRTQLMKPHNVCLLDGKNYPSFLKQIFSSIYVKNANFQGLNSESPESLSTQSTFAVTVHTNGPSIHLRILKFYLQLGVGKGHLFGVMILPTMSFHLKLQLQKQQQQTRILLCVCVYMDVEARC